MLPYFAVSLPIFAMALFASQRRVYLLMWFTVFVLIVIFVGLRHHVGMDWNNYLVMIQRANLGSWSDSLLVAEPGYATLLYVSGQMGWGIYGAYLIGTIIFTAGVFKYARTTPNPWVALAVAFPYLIVVIAMSGARQTVAIGVLFWLFGVWYKTTLSYRIAFVFLATAFHASAIIFLLLITADLQLRKSLRVLIFLFLTVIVAYGVLTSASFDFYQRVYITGGDTSSPLESGGAMFHVMLNAGPAALAMALGARAKAVLLPDKLHLNMAYAALAMIPIALVASTVASRFSIYLFPISIMVLSSLPIVVKPTDRLFLKGLMVFALPFVMYVWLGYANNAHAWHNYSNALFIEPSRLELCCK